MTRITGKIPLRTVLVVPFIIQIFLAVGLTGWLSFRTGQQAVNDVASQLRAEITARIEQKLDSYLENPHLINQTNANFIESELFERQNVPTKERFFWKQLQDFSQVTNSYYGTIEGDEIGARRTDEGDIWVFSLNEFTEHRFHYYAIDEKGRRTQLVKKTTSLYDPRERPWYQRGKESGQAAWSDIFYSATGRGLVITAVQPIYNNEDQLQGVLGSSFVFSWVDQFLRSLQIGKTGHTFILERSGHLVATSIPENPVFIAGETGEVERIEAINSDNPLISSATRHLMEQFGDLQAISHSRQLDFEMAGETQFLQVAPYKDEWGADWLIVVVIPEADFMERIEANTQTTILLCIIALILATLFGILTAHWITQPLLRLNNAAKALAKGDWEQTVHIEREDEVGELAHSFNQMAEQLQDSFTKLEEKNLELQQLDQLKDEFLANTSHELKTPLNGIIGLAESLIDGAAGEMSESAQANLELIVSSGQRLSSLVNDILDFSKLKNRDLELQLKPLSMCSMTRVVLTLSEPLIAGKPLQLINKIPPDCPPVLADENRVQQILHNLVGNAIKFTESGTITVSSQLREEEGKQSYLAIQVADTGIGISEAQFDHIFQSFEQGDGSIARNYGGTGLGLAVTKQLVHLHQGEIWVESTLGEGSCFTFTFPLAEEGTSPDPEIHSPMEEKLSQIQPSQTDPVVTTSPSGNGYNLKGSQFNILIVDDEPINLQVLTNHLSLQNYAITQASSGKQALDSIEKNHQENQPFDLVILDIMMPKMSGYEVCEQLRERYPAHELPVLMLTAKNQVNDLVTGFQSGANDYLTKPFSKDELLARIKAHLHLAKINTAYGRFVPHEFLEFLKRNNIFEVELGDQIQQEMTILFSDIRSFTTLSEQMSPQENFNFINAYLKRVSPAIRKYNGFIDKYIGDAIMALFPGSANEGLQAAIAMQKEVTDYNHYRENRGRQPIRIGIGLHTGKVILGTIGESERMEGTVISDTVNLASRIEGLTKLYNASIVVSERTLYQLDRPNQYHFRFLDKVQVKGKQEPVSVFEILDGDPETIMTLKLETRTDFEKGLMHYHSQEFEKALIYFQKVLAVNENDEAAQIYVERIQRFEKYGVPTDWEGVEALFEK